MRIIPNSEFIVNPDGSAFHLHIQPDQLADKIVMMGDPDRVTLTASFFDTIECDVRSREFHTITGIYKGKRLTALSHGIGTDNIDIVMTELDAFCLLYTSVPALLMGQSVDDAKRWYNEGNIAAAKPVFEAEHRINPGNAQLNHWLGVIAFNEGEYQKALQHLEVASQKNIPESYLYLARLYTMMYRFEDAEKEFARYERANRRNKEALASLADVYKRQGSFALSA